MLQIIAAFYERYTILLDLATIYDAILLFEQDLFSIDRISSNSILWAD